MIRLESDWEYPEVCLEFGLEVTYLGLFGLESDSKYHGINSEFAMEEYIPRVCIASLYAHYAGHDIWLLLSNQSR
jgi:hypothetical protein